jgi:hypothetical protein
MTMTTFKAIEKASGRDAVEHARARGGVAVLYGGKVLVAGRALAAALERAAARGLADFAYLAMDDAGRVMTIPVGR